MSVSSEQHIQRKFGFCKISWRIENFWLITCKKNWEIHSPEFTVRAPQSTSWKMILKPLSDKGLRGDYYLSVYLERLKSDPGPDVVRANWKLTLRNCKRKDNLFTEIEYLFKKNHRYGENIENMTCLLSDFEPFELDDLYIQCQLIVSCDTDSIIFFQCINSGLKSLSDDLHILYEYVCNPDIVIRIEHSDIQANKAILHARNSTLASIIDRKPEIKVIDLLPSSFSEPHSSDSVDTYLFNSSFINTDAVERIFHYIYCGNLGIVLRKPSICLSHCAQIFDISEVIPHYIPDELNLISSVDVEEHVLFWLITNFESSDEEYILSPPFTEEVTNLIWRLKLFPKGDNNNEEYVSLYAEIDGERLTKDACLEFAIMDVEQQFYAFRRLQKSLGTGEILGFNDFIERDCLKSAPFLSDGTLRIIFKLRTSVGVSHLSDGCCSITSVIVSPNEDNFRLLSEDIRELFNEGEFCDLIIYCDDEIFKVHSCIMIARSGTFHKIFGTHGISENEISIPDIKSKIFRILLSYIYSGTLEDWDHDIIHDLFLAASCFGVQALINSCSRILADSYLNSSNSVSC